MPLRVVGPLGQVGDLRRDRGPGGGGAGRPQRVVLGEQAAGQGRRVVEGTGDRDRLARPAARPVGGRPARSAAAGGRAPRSPCASVGRARSVQRLAGGVEHRDQVGAGHGEAGADPVQAQRDRAEQFGLAGCGGPGPGGVEQRPGLGGVAGAQPQVRLGGEQADQVGVGQPLAGGGDRGPQPGQVAGGLGEREPGGVGARRRRAPRPPRARRRPTGTAAAKWRASSAGNTGLPRSCRRSRAAATRWCRSSRRAGGRAA